MATKIFHGVPGSYKSSTAMWFEVLPALRSGRVVVTNLQGISTIEEMQRELKEVFPSTARIIRVSISSEKGMELMRNFYTWLPIGAFIFLDEVQDIYPNDRSFKAENYNNKGEGFYSDSLPVEITELYHKEQRVIKDNVNIDDYLDDIGESLFDERDYLRYPRTLRECFMRHRHYNWDILLATPDIKEVTGFVRSVCEKAYAHTSKDEIPFPYFKRRPLVHEHSAKDNGTTVKKNEVTTSKKIPLDVFKLYKSTATGKTTKSGLGSSAINWRIYGAAILVISYFIFLVFNFVYDDSNSENLSNVDGAAAPIAIPRPNNDGPIKNVKKDLGNNKKDNIKDDAFSFSNTPVSVITSISNFMNLPFQADKIFLSAVNTVYMPNKTLSRDYVFNLYSKGDSYSVDSDLLRDMGYEIYYKNQCLVELRSDINSHYAYCQPTNYDKKREEKKGSVAEPFLKSAVNL